MLHDHDEIKLETGNRSKTLLSRATTSGRALTPSAAPGSAEGSEFKEVCSEVTAACTKGPSPANTQHREGTWADTHGPAPEGPQEKLFKGMEVGILDGLESVRAPLSEGAEMGCDQGFGDWAAAALEVCRERAGRSRDSLRPRAGRPALEATPHSSLLRHGPWAVSPSV